MPFYTPIAPNFALTGKSIIIPVVSCANVGQLAVDLLISSLELRVVGVFNARYFIPVVGRREDSEEGITTPFELYGRDGVDIVVIQQRSPALKKLAFIEALLDFVRSSGFAAALFLAGVDLSNRTDSQMMMPTYYVHPPNAPPLANSPLSSLSQLPLQTYTSPVFQHPHGVPDDAPIPFIPGGGLTRRILSSLPSGWPIPTAALLHFVFEGDNRADAQLLAAVASKVAKLDGQIQQWKQPTSWKQGLFGTPHDQTLYG
ncbi:hypothetical protein HGRIS_002500 [Hohenbuehelia grisea]|uniref:Proteasome assembly chaperone 2 n=1 Tax=Hohenbuehelia grisea TaxID=104357 RepID=A0ABR3JMK8_9AGAR